MGSVKDGQQDDPDGASNAAENSEAGQTFVEPAGVGREASTVSEPSLRDHSGVQEDDHDGAASDEKRFQLGSTDI